MQFCQEGLSVLRFVPLEKWGREKKNLRTMVREVAFECLTPPNNFWQDLFIAGDNYKVFLRDHFWKSLSSQLHWQKCICLCLWPCSSSLSSETPTWFVACWFCNIDNNNIKPCANSSLIFLLLMVTISLFTFIKCPARGRRLLFWLF